MEDEEEGKINSDLHGNERWTDINGNLHRLHGPAFVSSFGTKAWYLHGKAHRDDGPAWIWPDGIEEWYKDDVRYEPSAHELMLWKMKQKKE